MTYLEEGGGAGRWALMYGCGCGLVERGGGGEGCRGCLRGL